MGEMAYVLTLFVCLLTVDGGEACNGVNGKPMSEIECQGALGVALNVELEMARQLNVVITELSAWCTPMDQGEQG